VNESFLQYLWQFQYFDKRELTTTAGEVLNIINPGILNSDSGPDFSNVKIRIDNIDWVGNVEIHIQSLGWYEHKHDQDQAYENVVLHVVWEENKPVYRKDGTRIPALQLKHRVEDHLIKSYHTLINNPRSIPCEKSFPAVDAVIKHSMIDKALMQRLETKAKQITTWHQQNKGDWEETTYQLLAANFGFKINKEPFLQLAKSLPYKFIQKHRDQLMQVESLLFGQAGFLVAKTKDEYLARLFNEFQFLGKKYDLINQQLQVTQWKFLRLRPANFPTLRLAQFASLLATHKSIFSSILELPDYKALVNFFGIQPSSYWQNHYRFGKKSKTRVPDFGESSRDTIIINTVVPLLVAYGQSRDDWSLVDRAVQILQAIPSEKNKITKLWQNLGYPCNSAFDSQGMIGLIAS
jgi:hypothetical protein